MKASHLAVACAAFVGSSATAAQICVEPNSDIVRTWEIGDPAPAPALLTVSNCDPQGGPFDFLAWASTCAQSWVRVEPPFGLIFGSDTDEVTVSLDPLGLDPGDHEAVLRFQHIGEPNDFVEILVKLTVVAPEANLSLFANEGFEATYAIGGAALPTETVLVGNVGPEFSLLDWTATTVPPAPWLVLTPPTGQGVESSNFGGTPDTMLVNYLAAGLAPGTYETDIVVSNDANPLDFEVVPVKLTIVDPMPDLCLDSAEPIKATYEIAGPVPPPVTRIAENCGHELSNLPLKVSTIPTAEWVTLTPMSGLIPGDCPGNPGLPCNQLAVEIGFAPEGLAPGLYDTIVRFENLAVAGDTIDVPVSLIVTMPGAQIAVTPSAPIEVDYDIGGTVPGDIQFTVSNVGPAGSILNFSFSETPDVPWLFHTPPAGTLASGESTTATIQFAVAGLTEAKYTTAIRFQNEDNAAQFVEIPVTLNVHLPKPNLCVDGSDAMVGTPIAFTHTISDPPPAPQFRTVSNCGDELSTLGWALFGDPACSWLHFTPAAGSLEHLQEQQVTFTADPTGLEEGNYQTTVRFQNVFDPFDYQDILVTLSVDQPDADLCLDDTSTIDVEYIIGFDVPGPFVRTIQNCGPLGSLLTYSVTTNDPAADWLFFEPLAGSLESGETDDFNIVFVVADVPPGFYSQTLTFQNVADETDFETITVNLTITDPIPDLCLEEGQGDISVAYEIGMPNPADVQFNLMNCGHEYSTLNYGITPEPPAAWLTITPLSDVMPPFTPSVPINLSFDPTGLVDGTYSTTLRLQNLDDPLDFEELVVTLVVGNIRFFPGDVLVGGLQAFDSAYEVEFDGVKDMKLTLKIKSGEGEPNGGVQFTVVDPQGGTTESKKVVFSSKKAGKRVFKLQHDGRHKLRIEPYKAKFTNWVLRTERKLPKLAKKYKATKGADSDFAVRVPVRALPNLTQEPQENALLDVKVVYKKKKFGADAPLTIQNAELPSGEIKDVSNFGNQLANGGWQILDAPGDQVGRFVFIVQGFDQPGRKIKVTVNPQQAVVGTTTIILPPL